MWSRKTGEELTELTKEKTYKITEEDLGSKIVLTVTGLEEKGYTGSLKAASGEVTAAQTETEDTKEAAEEETVPEEAAQPEEVPDEAAEEEAVPEEELIPDAEIEETFPDDENLELPETEDSYEEDAEAASNDEELPEEEWNEETYYEEELFPISIQETSGGTSEENKGEGSGETSAYAAESYTEDMSGVLDFGIAAAGEEGNIAEQYVTIQNTGTQALNFESISPEHFMVQDITETLEPGEKTQLWVRPREGIGAGSYDDTITYKSEEGAEVSFSAKACNRGNR